MIGVVYTDKHRTSTSQTYIRTHTRVPPYFFRQKKKKIEKKEPYFFCVELNHLFTSNSFESFSNEIDFCYSLHFHIIFSFLSVSHTPSYSSLMCVREWIFLWFFDVHVFLLVFLFRIISRLYSYNECYWNKGWKEKKKGFVCAQGIRNSLNNLDYVFFFMLHESVSKKEWVYSLRDVMFFEFILYDMLWIMNTNIRLESWYEIAFSIFVFILCMRKSKI